MDPLELPQSMEARIRSLLGCYNLVYRCVFPQVLCAQTWSECPKSLKELSKYASFEHRSSLNIMVDLDKTLLSMMVTQYALIHSHDVEICIGFVKLLGNSIETSSVQKHI
jgi:hypothetical protein